MPTKLSGLFQKYSHKSHAPFQSLSARRKSVEVCNIRFDAVQERKPSVGGIICYKDTEIYYAIVQGRETGKWSFPKGHMNENEKPLECARREICEETGLTELGEPVYDNRVGYGHYYVFVMSERKELVAIDTKEIMSAMWATKEDMMRLQLNADIQCFLS